MPPAEDIETGSPEDWLRRARSNLAIAKQPKPEETLWEDLCFNAQQAAEKAVKAVLVSRGVDFPKTHDVGRLFGLLSRAGLDVPSDIQRAAVLTPYAMAARYPSEVEPATEEDHRRALSVAQQVVRWAEGVIGGS